MSSDGLAGAHLGSVNHSLEQIRICIESTTLTREYAEQSVTVATDTGMSGHYLESSQKVVETADLAVLALTQASDRLVALSTALTVQGA